MRPGMRKIALAALLLAIAPAAEAQSVKAGVEAWQSADYDSAVKIWRPLAEAGDADAGGGTVGDDDTGLPRLQRRLEHVARDAGIFTDQKNITFCLIVTQGLSGCPAQLHNKIGGDRRFADFPDSAPGAFRAFDLRHGLEAA